MSEQNSHINPSDFENLFSSNLSDAEKNALKDQLNEGSFEAEAMEGFDSLGDDAQALAAIREIKSKVAAKTGLKKERKIAFPIWKSMGIAAAIALFVVGGFFVTNYMEKDPTVAKNETGPVPAFVPKSYEDLGQSTEEIVTDLELEEDEALIEEPIEILEDKAQESLDAVSLLEQDKETLNKKENTSNYRESEYDFANEEDDLVNVNDNEAGFAPDPSPVTVTTTAPAANVRTNANKQVVSKAEELEVVSAAEMAPAGGVNSYFNIGKTNYDSRNYSTAISYFQNSLNNNERVVESQYYVAMSYYNLNKSNKALKYFDLVLSNNSTPLRYNAMWFKAITLEEKGDKKGAKALFEELANGTSGFKNQAADKLKDY